MNPFQDLFNRQKGHFATGVTRSRGWRIEQLDRMGRLLAENEAVLQRVFRLRFIVTTFFVTGIFVTETHRCTYPTITRFAPHFGHGSLAIAFLPSHACE